MPALRREFFERDPLLVSRALIGMELYSELGGAACAGIIVETEAYIGPDDRAAHTWKNRRTPRTEVFFGPRGRAYVYRIYGIHYCMNVVAGPQRMPAAILLRALRPTLGLAAMARNRGHPKAPPHIRALTSGPGRLAQALCIDARAYGMDLCRGPLRIRPSVAGQRLVRANGIQATARINIDYAGEWATKPWRFALKAEPCVSGPAGRPSFKRGEGT